MLIAIKEINVLCYLLESSFPILSTDLLLSPRWCWRYAGAGDAGARREAAAARARARGAGRPRRRAGRRSGERPAGAGAGARALHAPRPHQTWCLRLLEIAWNVFDALGKFYN